MSAFSFDSAAANYETTRALPPAVSAEVAQSALAWLGNGAQVVEIGIGTGRIGRPLAALGVRVLGVDVSRPMLAQLCKHLNPADSLQPVQADARCLPIVSGSCAGVVAVHVFHLIPRWSEVLAEVRRVLQPDGVFLLGHDWRPPDAPGERLLARWRTQLHAQDLAQMGDYDFEHIQKHLLNSGAQMEERFVGQWTSQRTLAQTLEAVGHRPWGLDESVKLSLLVDLRAWATAEFGPLDTVLPVERRFCWQAFWWAR